MKRVLFIDSVHPILDEMLTAAGYRCEQDYQSGYAEIVAKLPDYAGLVVRSRLPIDNALLRAGGQLKFVARSGSGLENIDTLAAKELSIAVISSPEGNRDAVAEHAIGMLLLLFNQLRQADVQVRNGIWDREGNRGTELSGKTVGIIGFGQMGSALAERLQGFRCRILACDKYKSSYAPTYVEEVSLAKLQSESDIISIHLPLSPETDYFVDEGFISAFAKPFYLINTARGRHVKTDALVSALESGHMLGACLDVLEYEKKSLEQLDVSTLPAAYRALIASQKVVLTPHVAGWTWESYIKLSKVLGEKILNLGW